MPLTTHINFRGVAAWASDNSLSEIRYGNPFLFRTVYGVRHVREMLENLHHEEGIGYKGGVC